MKTVTLTAFVVKSVSVANVYLNAAVQQVMYRQIWMRKSAALCLMAALLVPILSPAIAYANYKPTALQQFKAGLFTAPSAASTTSSSLSWLAGLATGFGFFFPTDKAGNKEKKTPESGDEAKTKEALANRIKSIKADFVPLESLKVGQTVQLFALPLDERGAAVHEIASEWSSSDETVLLIDEKGKANAKAVGETTLTVKAGAVSEVFTVSVVADDKAEKNGTLATKSNNAAKTAPSGSALLNILPDNERESVYLPENNLGAPPGQTEMDSPNLAAALRIKHRAGIANYSFGVPFASLPGRGIDAGAGMTYNSRTWNEVCLQYGTGGVCTQKHFTYDVEQSWIAPGFSSGFGYLETRAVALTGTSHHITPTGLTDSDGTRHQLFCQSYSGSLCNSYTTTDGTFIKTSGQFWVSHINGYQNATFSATYPDGSTVHYAGARGTGNYRKHYPVALQDRNGNLVRISYIQDESGRISKITDTLNREIKFYYENDANGNPDKLVTVTIPGMNAGQELQTIRFYYETMALQTGGFVNGSVVTAPTSIRVLRYVYFPMTGTGYKYDYHPRYGMITKISRRAGMTVSYTLTSQTGPAPTEGTEAASTTYNYPDGSQPQSEVPKYTERIDDWAGRTAPNPARTLYDVPEPTGTERVSSITVKDDGFDVEYKTVSHNGGGYLNGMIKETIINKRTGPPNPTTGERPYATQVSKTVYTWTNQAGAGGRQNPRLTKTEVTNEVNQTKATEFEYDGYNNQTAVKEYDFAAQGTLGTLLRRTEISYETNTNWIGKNLLRLPKLVRTIVNGTTVSKTLYEYDHNGNDTTIVRRDDIDVNTHATSYNPAHPARTVRICPDGTDGEGLSDPRGCVTIHYPGYNASSAYRGNVTKVGRMLDVSATTINADPNANVTNMNYDIAGNLISASLSCCQNRTITYDKANEYAYPISQISGSAPTQLTTSATYNRNTGLVTQSKDENEQITSYTYNPSNLSLTRTDYPNGGYTTAEYDDSAISSVKTKTRIDAYKESENWQFADGRGQTFRSRVKTPEGAYLSSDAEFDALGRAKKNFNPYTVTGINDARPSNIAATEVEEYDALGRAVRVRLQDGVVTTVTPNTAAVNYADADGQTRKGTLTHLTDGSGKSRWMTTDALGRTIRADEPDAAGFMGTDGNNPVQPTHYYYDGNDNLTRAVQATGGIKQERVFVYDSLSRLIHERQPEMSPTLDVNGGKSNPDPVNRWTAVFKYNSFGLLTEGFDARGVKTAITYDSLNRVETIAYSNEPAGYTTPTVTYTYDEPRNDASGNPYFNKGRLTKVTTAQSGTITPETSQIFDYDKMGQIAKQVQQVGGYSYQLKYTYNLAGHLVAEEYPTGKVVRTAVDAMGRTARVYDAKQNYVSGFQYNQNGTPAAHFLGNGLKETFAFDPNRLQFTSQSLLKDNEVLQRYDYSYQPIANIATGSVDPTKNNGQLAKVTGYIGGTTANPTKQWEQRFAYDSLGRISEAREHRGNDNALSYKQRFDYDRWGNMYRKQSANDPAGQATPLAYTPIEESTNSTGDNGNIDKKTNRFTGSPTTGLQYDEAGNAVKDFKFRGLEYFYDANNRMVKTRPVNTAAESLSIYDALGHRVATKIGEVWRIMVYDAGGKIVCEYTNNQPNTEKSVQYVFSDQQGSTRTITNASGTPLSRSDYTAFGEEIGAGIGQRTTEQGYSGYSPTREKYALTERDEATGLDHTPWRKHEQKAGRWTSPDPYMGSMSLGDPQSFNRYTYTNNDPINLIDPEGLNAQAPNGSSCNIINADGTVSPGVVVDGRCVIGGVVTVGGGGPSPISWGQWRSLTFTINLPTTPRDPSGIRERGPMVNETIELLQDETIGQRRANAAQRFRDCMRAARQKFQEVQKNLFKFSKYARNATAAAAGGSAADYIKARAKKEKFTAVFTLAAVVSVTVSGLVYDVWDSQASIWTQSSEVDECEAQYDRDMGRTYLHTLQRHKAGRSYPSY